MVVCVYLAPAPRPRPVKLYLQSETELRLLLHRPLEPLTAAYVAAVRQSHWVHSGADALDLTAFDGAQHRLVAPGLEFQY